MVDPDAYSHLVFVCGPLGNGPPVDELLRRFEGKKRIGVNVTMLDYLGNWNPFDLLIERDSSRTSHPDICFAVESSTVPVVALTLIDSQPEYGERNRLEYANKLIQELLEGFDVATVSVNTRLDVDQSLRSARAIESLIAKADVVISTRLHGMVLGLKNGVPVVAIDSVSGGAKIARQAATIGWPVCLSIDEIDMEDLRKAFRYCLSEAAGQDARRVAQRAAEIGAGLRSEFVTAFRRAQNH